MGTEFISVKVLLQSLSVF